MGWWTRKIVRRKSAFMSKCTPHNIQVANGWEKSPSFGLAIGAKKSMRVPKVIKMGYNLKGNPTSKKSGSTHEESQPVEAGEGVGLIQRRSQIGFHSKVKAEEVQKFESIEWVEGILEAAKKRKH